MELVPYFLNKVDQNGETVDSLFLTNDPNEADVAAMVLSFLMEDQGFASNYTYVVEGLK